MNAFQAALLLLMFGFNSLSFGQSGEADKPTVAFLGTFHFAGSSDLLAMKAPDLPGEKRQAEIKAVVEALANYKPTKVIIEYPFGRTRIDSLYQSYLAGEHTLSINERQQIGFRLAEKMGHQHIYPADHRMNLPFNELMVFLKEQGKEAYFQELIADMKVRAIDKMQAYYDSHTLKEFYCFMNTDENDRLNRGVYLQEFNKMVSADNDIGVRVVSTWWERNFRIMANIDQIVEPGDRLLVLFGQGHTALFKPFYLDREDVIYEDVLKYLE